MADKYIGDAIVACFCVPFPPSQNLDIKPVNYSLIGDTANTASRLESANKQLTADGAYRMLVTEETFAYGSDRYFGQQV